MKPFFRFSEQEAHAQVCPQRDGISVRRGDESGHCQVETESRVSPGAAGQLKVRQQIHGKIWEKSKVSKSYNLSSSSYQQLVLYT